MARLTIEKQTGGSPFELQTRNGTSTDRWFWIEEGGILALPHARGDNITVPGATGLSPVPFVDESLEIRIPGFIAGVGATPALRRASFRTQMAALRVQLPAAGTMVVLKAYPPNESLTGAEVASVTAQLQRLVPLPVEGGEQQRLTIELLCVADPVAWSIA